MRYLKQVLRLNDIHITHYYEWEHYGNKLYKLVPNSYLSINLFNLPLTDFIDTMELIYAFNRQINSITDYSGIYLCTAVDGGNTITLRLGK